MATVFSQSKRGQVMKVTKSHELPYVKWEAISPGEGEVFVDDGGYKRFPRATDAEEIARRCNAHDDLIRELEFYASPDSWKMAGGDRYTISKPCAVAKDQGDRARRAINKAKGESNV